MLERTKVYNYMEKVHGVLVPVMGKEITDLLMDLLYKEGKELKSTLEQIHKEDLLQAIIYLGHRLGECDRIEIVSYYMRMYTNRDSVQSNEIGRVEQDDLVSTNLSPVEQISESNTIVQVKQDDNSDIDELEEISEIEEIKEGDKELEEFKSKLISIFEKGLEELEPAQERVKQMDDRLGSMIYRDGGRSDLGMNEEIEIYSKVMESLGSVYNENMNCLRSHPELVKLITDTVGSLRGYNVSKYVIRDFEKRIDYIKNYKG